MQKIDRHVENTDPITVEQYLTNMIQHINFASKIR